MFLKYENLHVIGNSFKYSVVFCIYDPNRLAFPVRMSVKKLENNEDYKICLFFSTEEQLSSFKEYKEATINLQKERGGQKKNLQELKEIDDHDSIRKDSDFFIYALKNLKKDELIDFILDAVKVVSLDQFHFITELKSKLKYFIKDNMPYEDPKLIMTSVGEEYGQFSRRINPKFKLFVDTTRKKDEYTESKVFRDPKKVFVEDRNSLSMSELEEKQRQEEMEMLISSIRTRERDRTFSLTPYFNKKKRRTNVKYQKSKSLPSGIEEIRKMLKERRKLERKRRKYNNSSESIEVNKVIKSNALLDKMQGGVKKVSYRRN